MLRGLYLSATGMITQELRQKVISNNLANANTNGFKSEKATVSSFSEMLLNRLEKGENTPIGYFSPGVMVDRVHTNFSSGNLEETGCSTDLALTETKGGLPVFFSVQAGNSELYTRDGEFQVDANGFLVTSEGYPVQGQYGPIFVGTKDFEVDDVGQVIVNDQVVDQLRIVTFSDPNLLKRQGNNFFLAPQEMQPEMGVDYKVKQGWLEKGNVDITREFIDMLSVLRSYEVNQRVLQAQDQTLAKSVNEIGSLR
ncbi:MAG: flagellar basal-body rod protein FlgF [Clostridia bacterium]|nr:flagellar basal-body rod protein FlgF [Clostridia bacterium]